MGRAGQDKRETESQRLMAPFPVQVTRGVMDTEIVRLALSRGKGAVLASSELARGALKGTPGGVAS